MFLFTAVSLFVITSFSVITKAQRSAWIATNQSQWENQFIDCDQNEPCAIICGEESSCKSAIITCPANDTCTLACVSRTACARATIHPPIDPELFNFTWNGYGSLQNVEYPFYDLDDYANFTLNCNGNGKCSNLDLFCPKYAYCNLNCSAINACAGVR